MRAESGWNCRIFELPRRTAHLVAMMRLPPEKDRG